MVDRGLRLDDLRRERASRPALPVRVDRLVEALMQVTPQHGR
jgi:hypothetical protein